VCPPGPGIRPSGTSEHRERLVHGEGRAHALEFTTIGSAARIRAAAEWASEALALAKDPGNERLALYALGWTRILQGQAVDDLDERFRAASEAPLHLADSLDRVAAVRLVWRGVVDEARASLTQLRLLADERGELLSYIVFGLHLCELELRAGNWAEAIKVLDEWGDSPEHELAAPCYERCRGLLAAGQGLPDEAERWAAAAIARGAATGVRWEELEVLRARGVASLLAHDAARAVESMNQVWAHMQREGVADPAAFPVAADLVDALVQLGRLDEARTITRRVRTLAQEQEHPWALATAKRCGAIVRLAAKYDPTAAAQLEEAIAAYERLGLRFDRARSLLALGRAQRRHRKWGAARGALDRAAAEFDEIGSEGWAAEARSEARRVGARRPRPAGQLTPTEQRVVRLAADGLANKEIAQRLFVSVHTVEVHLSHAYAKLGIHTRVQLSRALEV
jgi:DNA-binding CsgD family transcriptional regulator